MRPPSAPCSPVAATSSATPITPSTEGAELMARLLPKMDGVFLQAVSEVAAVNMMYGAGGAGMRSMTFTSSPGFSLMVEGISYMIGAEIPGVFIDVMRGGPGLGNIAPEQSDIKLLCRGLGHGNTHGLVFAPSTPQEMLDLTMTAFDLAFHYRNPVVIAADGYLGQMTGRVLNCRRRWSSPDCPSGRSGATECTGATCTARSCSTSPTSRRTICTSTTSTDGCVRTNSAPDCFHCDDADWLIVACNTPARMAKGAVRSLRDQGIKVGLFRPITLCGPSPSTT